MKINILLAITSLFLNKAEGSFFKDDGLCCLKCTEPLEKYYSIDTKYNMCGECCMDPKDYWLYKMFEPNLSKDEKSNIPCSDRGYGLYYKTETHGFLNIKMTLDMYKPSPSQIYQDYILLNKQN